MSTPPVFLQSDTSRLRAGETIRLAGEEGRHAADVRRIRPGEMLQLTDGRGAVADCRVMETRRGELLLEVTTGRVTEPSPLRLVAAQAVARGGRDEAAVEAMTEIGVDEILGWTAQRCIARWSDRTDARWRAVVQAAAKQSRRSWWPSVDGPVSTDQLAARCATVDLALVLHEAADDPLSAVPFPDTGSVLVVVGPEGGITVEEVETLGAAGARPVRLGDTVLRSSTAGVAALAVVCASTRWRS